MMNRGLHDAFRSDNFASSPLDEQLASLGSVVAESAYWSDLSKSLSAPGEISD